MPERPENVEAVQVLAQGWTTDMYAGTVYDETAARAGIYGVPGEPGETIVDIPTTAGTARAYVLPGPAPQLTFVDVILKTLLEATQVLNFAHCAAPIGGTEAVQTEFLTQNSTPNTALSLDGKASKGQSVGQHVCTG